MPTDILSLAGITFDAFSTPRRVPFGGNQMMVVHKLPGGSRVIDTLGPDDDDIAFEGQFFGADAYASATALDGIRAAGQVVPLIFGGQTRQVVIAKFSPRINRYPNWVEYFVVCTVSQNPALGDLTLSAGGGIDDLVGGDMATSVTASQGVPSDPATALAQGTIPL